MDRLEIGYHASHEQFSPSSLLELVQLAEAAGFQAVTSSDHFYPWSESQGQSGYAWSWLGAAMQATAIPFGVVTAPGYRYHPAIVAQGAATLAEMFPDRFWLALGSGQLMNEGITGTRWPPKAERNERLLECAEIIRRLWAGETVTHHGLVSVELARLYTRPETPPLLFGAAITPQTAEWVGGWADGLITTSRPPEDLKEVVDAFRRGGGGGKPMYLKVDVSYAADEADALRGAWEQWRYNAFPSSVNTGIRLPEMFDAASRFVRPEDMRESVRISSDPEQHIAWLREDARLGFERLFIHNVNTGQREFVEFYGSEVLPALIGKEASHAAAVSTDR
ncbi:MAG: TIGR03885 family FMN-dependent LLM class oxidoreductase [Methanomicrobiales archaeon]|nr:TIGR03885 family FMN-dependent LLM class oxidoreductase [Methanomicrobiales archaeon]